MAVLVAILDFRSKRFYLILILQVTLMELTKFQVKWLFCSGQEAQS